MPALAKKLMTVDEFLATSAEREGRWELVDGVAYSMAPQRIEHGRVKFAVVLALKAAIRRAGLSCEAVIDSVAIRVSERTAYIPDALVYCSPMVASSTREIVDPVIVVEVASDSTRAHDVGRKLAGYFSVASVRHYLFVDPEDRSVAHYARAAAGSAPPRVLREGALRLDPPGLDLAITDFFVSP